MERQWTDLSKYFFHFANAENSGGNELSILFSDLPFKEKTKLLDLDALHDREEYSTFREVLESMGPSYTLDGVIKSLSGRSPSVEKVRLLYRITNREVDKLTIWGDTSLLQDLQKEDWRFASVDLRDVSPLERSLVAAAVLESLYRSNVQNPRTAKVTFFVIEEAHNFCPAVPWFPHQEAPRRILHEIAAEGRKYGAFLMLLTQNPSKLSEQALLQCDNVILMKMTSAMEVQTLGAVVKDAGPRLAQLAFGLSKGEAVCMGGIVKSEATVKLDLRKTKPGGEDVSKDWAKRKP